ncbi:MAG: hypothetical protein WBN81_12515 [Gammaproteobacteria bacterium]
MKTLPGIVLFALLASPVSAADQLPVSIPLNVEYGFLQQALIKRLYTEPDQVMEIRNIGNSCSKIMLSDPHIDGLNGLLRITNRSVVDIGLPMGSK